MLSKMMPSLWYTDKVEAAMDGLRSSPARPAAMHERTQLERARSRRSDALENLRASSRDRPTIRPDGLHGPCYGGGSLADGSSGPDRGPPAIRRPRPRGRECDATLSDANAASQIIGNGRTWARRATDENPAEISSRGVDVQDFQDGTALTLPN
jgi:hypothetical protein